MWIATALIFPMSLSLALGMLIHWRWDWGNAAACITFTFTGVIIACSRIAGIRRAFARSGETRGRISHLQHFEWTADPSKRGRVIGEHDTYLRVVYPSPLDGSECVAEYTLGHDAVARLRPSIGGEVVLIVDPALETPLLRDIYLDR